MEVQLLDFVLSLLIIPTSHHHSMHEQQLRRHLGNLIRRISLQREIPDGELLVTRHGEHRRVVRRPLHGCDRCTEVVEVTHTTATTRESINRPSLQVTNVPDTEGAVVTSRHHQIAHLPMHHSLPTRVLVPVNDIHIAVMRVHREHALSAGVARIPELDCAVHAARREHSCLRWTPLQIFHRCVMRQERLRVRPPARLRRRGHKDLRGAVARHQLSLVTATPVNRVTLALVTLELEQRLAGSLLVTSRVSVLKGRQLRSDVVDTHDALVGPGAYDLGSIRKTLRRESRVTVLRECDSQRRYGESYRT